MKSFLQKIHYFWILTAAAFIMLSSAKSYSQSCSPGTTAVSCGTTTTFNLGASGYAGDNPTAGDGGCNPCCYTGADLDCDGLQDVPFSVENARFYRYCNTTGSSQVVSINADEPGTGGTCNLQGAVWTGTALNGTTMDCGNPNYANFDSNSGGAADGFTFGSVTVADGECAYIMVDGYAGTTCTGVGLTVTCPCTPPVGSASPQTICSGTASSVTLNSTLGGTTYTWTVNQSGVTGASNGSGSTIAQTLTATGSSAGTATYTVTPTAAGCPGTPFTVVVTVNPRPVMTSANAATICSGGTVSIPLTANVASTFVWSAASNTNVTGESTTNQNSSTLSNTLTNTTTSVQTVTYTVTPTSTTGSCLGTPQTVTVTVNPIPTMTSANTATICSGATLNIPLTSNVTSTFSWVANANANTTGESTTNQTGSPIDDAITNTTTSTQTVTYTVTPTSSAGNCPGTPQTVTVTVNPAPTMTSASTATICSGGTLNIGLTATMASTFTWVAANNANTTGESTTTQNTNTINNTITNSSTSAQNVVYTVTPTSNPGGCVGPAQTVTVTVNPVPTVTSANTATICSGGTVSIPLTANVASSFVWVAAANGNVTGESTTNQNTSTLSNTLTNTTTSAQTVTYTVTPTSTAGSCPGTPQTVTVTVNPVPTMTSANTTTCSGIALNIGLTSDIASTYSWVAANNANTTGESTTAQTGNTINNTITNNTAAAQTVSYTVTPTSTAGSCVGTPQTVTVTVNPAPTMTSANTATICSGGTLNIGLTSNVAATYSWVAANNANTTGESTTAQSSNTINNTITNSSTAAQTVTYTVTPTSTVGSCVGAPQTVTVTVNPIPTMTSANTATICSGGTVNIPLTANVASSFTWIASNNANTTGESTTSQSTSTLNNTITNSSTSVQTVTYTVTPTSTAGSCPGTPQTVDVTVNPTPQMTSANTATICSGNALNIGLTSDIASTYSWIAANNTNTTGESTTAQASNTINNTITNNTATPQTVTYTVTPTSTVGSCAGAPQTVTVTVNPTPAMTSATTATICSGGTLNIGLTSNVASTYSWIAANNTNTTGESTTAQTGNTINNTITNSTSSAETVTYTVTPTSTAGSCVGSPQTVTVTVNPVPAMTSANTATICSGGTVNIPLTANVASSFTWIAANNSNTTGESTTSQTTSTLNNTITNTSTSAQTVTYTVTPTSTAGSCPGTPQTVNVTVNPTPTMTSATTATICSGATVTINLTSDIASTYSWIAADNVNTTGESTTAQTTSTLSNTITNNTTTSQNVTYTVTPTSTAGSCVGAPQTVTVTVTPAPVATFSYTGTPYCQNGTNPLPIFSGGGTAGTFSSTAGLSINTSTGEVNLSASTAGTYTVTNTIAAAGGCPSVSATSSITISPLPVATFSYTGTPYCQDGTDPSPVFSGGGVAGTFSSTAGLSINSGTGLVDLSASTAGTYTVTNTIAAANGCPAVTATSSIVINSVDDPSFNYTPSTFCASGANPTPTITGTTGGVFSSTAGLTFISTSTGQINLSASTIGTYTVTYTTGGACPSSSTQSVTITNAPNAAFSYAGPYCGGGTNPTPTFPAGSSAGTFSSTVGLIINSSTGEIDLTASTAGTYTVTNSIAASGGCPAVSANASVTIEPEPVATFSYSGSPYCSNGTNATPTFTGGGAAGTFTSTAGLVFVNANTGEINLSSSTPGTYTVTNTIAASGGCPTVTATSTITITPLPVGTFSYTGTPYCQNATNPSPTFSGGGVAGTFSSGAGLVINAGSGLVDLASSTPGSYTVTNTIAAANGCPAVVETSPLVINAVDNASFTYSPTTFCITGTNPTPTITGTSGGSFTSTAGLTFVSSASGEINLSASSTGTYTITYTTSGACPANSSSAITITNAPSASFSYSGPYCTSSTDPTPVFGAGASAGTFSSTAGLVFVNSSTGEIDLSASTPGTYTVTNSIAASGGCAAVSETSTVTITQPSAGTFNYAGSPYCQSSADPSPIFTGGGVAGTFSSTAGLVINSSTGAIDLSASTAGTYTVTNSIAAANGCPAVTETFNITVNAVDDPSFSYTASTYCMSGSNPTAIVTGTPGGVFSSNPSTGVTLNAGTGEITLSSSSTGTYVISYATTGTCPDTATMSLTLTSAPDATLSYAGPYCTSVTGPVAPVFAAGASAGSVTSTAGLTLDGLTGEIDPSTSTAGTYIVTNTINLAGCSPSSDTALVVINQTPDATSTPSSATICSGSTASLTISGTVSGTNFNYTSVSSALTLTGNTTGAGNISDVLTNTGSATDSVTYTITPDANGCTGAPINVVVVVQPAVTLSVTPTLQSICSGSTTNITFISNVSSASFSWTENSGSSTLSGASAGSGSSISQALTSTATTTDSATYIITSMANGCPGPSDTATVYVNPIPTVLATVANDSICSNTSAGVSLSGTIGGTTFSWTASSGSASITGFSSSNGTSITDILTNTGTTSGIVTYMITPTSNGCTGTVTNAAITVYPAVTMTVTPLTQTICSGAAASTGISSAVSGATFSWTSTGSSTLTGYTNSSGGSITDVLTNSGSDQDTAFYVITPMANGCTGANQTALVIVSPVPTVTATPSSSTICSGATGSISLSSSSASATYGWTQVSGPSIGGATAGSGTQFTNTALTNSGATVDSVVYTITPTAAGCSGPSVTASIIVTPLPTVSPSVTTESFCSGGTTTPTLTGTPASASFSWTVTASSGSVTGQSAGTGTSISQQLTNSGTTSETVTYTIVPDANGCVGASSTYTVTVNPTPTITATPANPAICSGGSTAINLTGGVAGTNFSWTVASPASVSGATAGSGTQIGQVLISTSGTTETVAYTVNAIANGCTANTTVNVTVTPQLSAPLTGTDTTYCSGSAIQPLTSVASPGATVTWYDNASLVTPVGTGSPFTPTVSATTTFYAVQSLGGCSSSSSPVTITIISAPVAQITGTPSKGQVPLTVSFANGSTNANTYSWNFGNGDTSTSVTPSVVFNETGTYTVVMVASNGVCTDSVSTEIIVEGESFVIIPNVFSPNGDGNNDRFLVQNESLSVFNLTIYNRWGTLLYKSESVNAGWDGTTPAGIDAPEGTYYYVMTATGKDGKNYDETGHLLLTR